MSNIDVQADLSGLIPFEKYDYYFEGMGANWPATITPLSGSFRPYGDNARIDGVVHFCSTKNACSGAANLLDYSTESCDHNTDLFTTLRVRLVPESLNQVLYSDIFNVKCSGCLGKTTIGVPTEIILNQNLGNEYIMTSVISGLQPEVSYSYEVFSNDANWPVKIKPITGILRSSTDNINLKSSIYFCSNTGLCPQGAANILSYEVNDCISNTYKHASLQIKLSQLDCSEDEQVTYSNPVEVYCIDCLPKMNITMPTVVTLQNANNVGLNALVSGLVPNHTYSYEFKGLEANWPSTLSRPTGSFVSTSDTQLVSTRFTFCPNTGICEADGRAVLDYDMDSYCIFGKRYPFSKIKLHVQPETCELNAAESETLTVYCSGCLPDMKIFMPAKTSVPDYVYSTTVTVSGVRPNESYDYVFGGLDSNWPTIVSPISGTFKLDSDATSNMYAIPVNIMFCTPTGICPPGTEGLIDYEYDNYAQKKLNKGILSTKLNLTVTPKNCEFPDRTSDVWTLECNDCLPCFSYCNLNFYDSPEMYLESTCCSGNKLLTVNVDGANPGDEYKYTFSTTTPEFISFAPTTGLIYFNNTGAGNLNTIMTTEFVAGQQGVVNCTLEHVDTGINAINFLVVRCSGECSI